MKRIYLILLVIVTAATSFTARADNLTAETVNFGRADTTAMHIGLENGEDAAWTVYQFVLTLPEGLTLATNERGKYIYELSARHHSHCTLTIHPQTATRYAIVCYSTQGKPLTGTSGTLLSLMVQAEDSLRGRQLTAQVSEVLFSTKGGEETTMDNLTVPINVAARITLTATSYTVEYGEPLPTYGFTTEGAKLEGTPSIRCDAVQGSQAGTYPIVIERGTVANYNDIYVNGTLTITKAPLTVTAENYSRTYGDNNPAFTASYKGFKLDETSATLTSQPAFSCEATTKTTVGEYPITATGADSPNYDITYIAGTLTVTKAPLTITANDATRKYGDEDPSFTVTYNGFKNGERATALTQQPTVTTVATATSSVGSYVLTAADAESPNYDFIYVDGTLTVTKAPLTITADDQTRRQGEVNPPLTVTYNGFKNGETSEVLLRQPTVLTQRVSSSATGTYPITVNGTEAQNYEIKHVNGTFTVLPAIPVTLTANSYFREYGDENPVFEFTSEGAEVEGQPLITCEATPTTPIGIYPIVIAKGGVLNYNETYVNGTLTITKAPLVIGGGNYHVTQGGTMPTLTPIYTGFKNGETADVLIRKPVISCEATSTKELGTFAVTVRDAEAQNYDITYEAGTLTVTDAPVITLTANSYTRVYGEENPTFDFISTGAPLEGGMPVISCDATATSPVGTYPIVIAKGTVSNYNDYYVNGTLTITKAPVIITVDDASREYGAEDPVFTATYSGFKNGETATIEGVLTTPPALTTTATATSWVGKYDIKATGAVAQNYSFSYVGGTLTIEKAPLVITANDAERKQGEDNPTFTATYTGFRNGETNAVLTKQPMFSTIATPSSDPGIYDITVSSAEATNYAINYVSGKLTVIPADSFYITALDTTIVYGEPMTGFQFKAEGATLNGTPAINCEATATSPVGTYDIIISKGSVENYNDHYVNGTLTIVPAPLTVNVGDATREYGEEDPAFSVTYEGFKNGETAATEGVLTILPTFSTTAVATSPVGEYAISCKGAEARNYTFNYIEGKLTITKAPVIVTANDASREYGAEDPVFTASYSGFKNDETATMEGVLTTPPSFTTTATVTSWVGKYDIKATGAEAQNYSFSYVGGTLTIEKAPLVITANDAERKQGEDNPTFTATYTGFRNGETASVLSTQPTFTTSATPASAPGVYDIIASGAEATNYAISYEPGKLTVNNAPGIWITALDTTIVYGEPMTGFQFKVEGATLKGMPAFTCEADETSPVGTYPIVISKGSVENYNDHYVNGTLTIVPATLTVTANDATREYGEENPELAFTITGFKNNEDESVLKTLPTVTTTATKASKVGEYAISCSGAEAQNYTFDDVDGTLTVTRAPLTVSVVGEYVRDEGDENPAFELAYSGWKLEDDERVLTELPTADTEATPQSTPGEYAITVSGGTAENYELNYVGSTMTVLKTIELTINALGSGTVSYGGKIIRQGAERFTLNVTQTADLQLTADENFHLSSVTIGDNDLTERVEDGHLTVGPFEDDASVWARYESNFTAEDSVTFTIRIEGDGSLRIEDETFDDIESTMRAAKGRDYVILFKPDEEKRLGKLTLNGEAVEVKDNTFVIYNVHADTTIVATFVDDLPMFAQEGITYAELKGDIGKVKVMPQNEGYVGCVVIPESVELDGRTFTVVGIDETAFRGNNGLVSVHIPATIELSHTGSNLFRQCENLAAIIWDAPFQLTRQRVGTVTNPNMLYYVTAEEYAPSFNNVIVNGQAKRITLDGERGFIFHCPRAFHAQKIDYYHYFELETRKNVCRGWEAIALPFDVTEIKHQRGDVILPFAAYDFDTMLDMIRPFWLYEYGEDDQFKVAGAIKANTPYIISMPNDPAYIEEYRLGGGVTFIGEDVDVLPSEEESLVVVKGQKRSFHPTFQQVQVGDLPFYALNTEKWRSYEAGSIFMKNQRNLRPFEAYFLSESNDTKEEWFGIFDGGRTGITETEEIFGKSGNFVYDMAGRRVNKPQHNGLYIVNGRKVVVR